MRRYFASFAGVILMLGIASAQDYPSRPLEMIIPFTAGSGLDVNGRAVARSMSETLKQQVTVLNRDGASGTIGFGALAKSPSDGYVIGFGPNTPITNAPYLVKGVKYDAGSFDYICQLFETIFVMAVGPGSRFKTVEDVLKAAKGKRNSLTYGSAGLGSVPHLSMVNMEKALDLKFQHVPYRGDAALLPALLRNDLDFAIVAIATVREQPKISVLAIFDDERNDAFPKVMTVKELGVKRNVPPGQVGIFAPKGLAPVVQEALNKACFAAANDPTVSGLIEKTGQRPKYRTGAQFQKIIDEDYKFKGELIKSLGLADR